MKIRWNRTLTLPLLALAVGGAAAFLANGYIRSRIEAAAPKPVTADTVAVVVPTADLPKGARLDNRNLAVRQVPRQWLHSNSVVPAQFPQVEGQELAMPATKGEQLTWGQIEGRKAPTLSARLVPGRRAVTVPVDEISSISGMLAPGDAIDLVASLRNQGRPAMVPVLQAVYVLATGTRVEQAPAGEAQGARTYTTVTLDVTPEEAKRIMAAREVGRITALLRAPGDRRDANLAMSDAMHELGVRAATPRADRADAVPVYRGQGEPTLVPVQGPGIAAPFPTAPAALPPALAGTLAEGREAAPAPSRGQPIRVADTGQAATAR